MNPIRILLTLLVCLLPLSLSAGELDGKSLVCETANADDLVGFRFVGGKVKTDWLTDFKAIKRQDGGWEPIEADYHIKRDVLKDDDTSYIVDRTKIKWGEKILNRQTLEFIESEESLIKWQCEVFSNDDDYWKQLENIRTQKQNKADEEKSKNKI